MLFKNISMVSILFSLTGCANLQWPPQEQVKLRVSAMSRATVPFNRFSDIPTSGVVHVKNGDTLFIISRRYGVSPQMIIDSNDLTPPYRLRRGNSLILPRLRVHVVERGDTLYKIARRYGVNLYEFARTNRLRAPFHIYPNQKLVLSSFEISEPSANGIMKKREKMLLLAKKNQKFSANNEQAKKKVILKSSPSKSKTEKPISKKLKSIAVPLVRTSGRFNWPVRGRLLSIYGAKGQGLHNDGINIIAPRGTAVRAAGSGVVVYAGNELRGFGNLILIKHSGGWVTAYAHTETLLVKRRDKVNKGQIIAKVGTSGNVVRPQLHFEVRKGKRAIDPLRHLRRLSANIIKNVRIFL
jgi:murein DD-endopeptidase MepM/ murein hydrolase activator NlpD